MQKVTEVKTIRHCEGIFDDVILGYIKDEDVFIVSQVLACDNPGFDKPVMPEREYKYNTIEEANKGYCLMIESSARCAYTTLECMEEVNKQRARENDRDQKDRDSENDITMN